MKNKNIFLCVIITFFMIGMIIQPNKSSAALQSNGGDSVVKTIGDWMLQIRQMQELGGTLGRTDNVDKTTLKSEATDLDIHMQKNTEYGAMAILSASSYGNPNKIQDGGTTTGNSTGIVINLNKELVAAGNVNLVATVFQNASNRYKNNKYTLSEVITHTGEAMVETKKWHGNLSNVWFISSAGSGGIPGPIHSALLRSYSETIFSYCADGWSSYGTPLGDAYYTNPYSSRAAIVVGTDL